MTINGLVIGNQREGTAIEFEVPPENLTNLTVIDYDPGSGVRHVVFNGAPSWSKDQTLRELKARNVCIFGAAGTIIYKVFLIDPIGRIQKPTEGAVENFGGYLETKRTVGSTFISALDQTQKPARVLISNTPSGLLYENTGPTFSVELTQFYQDFDVLTVTTLPDYTKTVLSYGFLPQTTTFTIGDTEDPTEYSSGTTLLLPDLNITETNESNVASYSEISDTEQLYDAIKYYEIYRQESDYTLVGSNLVSSVQTTLDFGSLNVVFDNTLQEVVYHNSANTSTVLTYNPAQNVLDFPSTTNTATFDVTTLSAAIENPTQTHFSNDGTKFYVATYGTTGNHGIHEFTLSTPYDLSTATFSFKLTDNAWLGNKTTQGVSFVINSTGTNIIAGFSGSSQLSNFTMSTAWDLSTAARNGAGFKNVAAEAPLISPMWLSADDTTLLISNANQSGALGSTSYRKVTLGTPGIIAGTDATTFLNTQSYPISGGKSIAGWGTYVYYSDQQLLQFFPDVENLQNEMDTLYGVSGTAAWVTDAQWETAGAVSGDGITYGYVSGTDTHSIYTFSATTDILTTYEHGTTLQPAYYSGGDAETLYVKGATNIATTASYDTVETDGVFTFSGVSTSASVIDANGVSANIVVTNIIAGSRIQVYNITQASEIANEIVPGTSYSYNYFSGAVGAAIAEGDSLRIRLAKQNGATAYNWFETIITAGQLGASTAATQAIDSVYTQIGIDGSTVTEFSYDNINVEIDLSDGDGLTTKRRLVAWLYYITNNSALAMSNLFGITTLIDAANVRINTDVVNLVIDNTGSQQVSFTDSDFYLYKSNGESWVKYPSSGNFGISTDSGKIYLAEGGGGTANVDLTSIESSLATLQTSVDAIPTTDSVADISALTLAVNDLQVSVNAIPTTDSVADLSAITSAIATLQTSVNAIPTTDSVADLSALTTAVSNLQTSVNAIPTTDSVADLTALSAAIAALQVSVDAIPTTDNVADLTTLTASVAEVEAKVIEMWKMTGLDPLNYKTVTSQYMNAGDITVVFNSAVDPSAVSIERQ